MHEIKLDSQAPGNQKDQNNGLISMLRLIRGLQRPSTKSKKVLRPLKRTGFICPSQIVKTFSYIESSDSIRGPCQGQMVIFGQILCI